MDYRISNLFFVFLEFRFVLLVKAFMYVLPRLQFVPAKRKVEQNLDFQARAFYLTIRKSVWNTAHTPVLYLGLFCFT